MGTSSGRTLERFKVVVKTREASPAGRVLEERKTKSLPKSSFFSLGPDPDPSRLSQGIPTVFVSDLPRRNRGFPPSHVRGMWGRTSVTERRV